ncbi:MAG: peptidoglycan DD-metalloendopeptidase family protein, partial [Bacteroidota bacterium]
FPKAWELMENDAVAVVAAERGTIIEKEDGHFDKNCSLNSSGNWNAIYIQHADGSSAWYGHLKANSLTGKGIGSTVERGEYLGIVGSSGASTAPHLHLELYNAQGEVIDPFAGACNGTVENSWWVKQRDYHDSAINQLEVSRFLPESDNCEEPNISNENNSFCANDEVHFIAWLRDLQYSQILQHSILRPDQSTFEYWENSLPGSQGDYLPASMVSQSFVLPRDPQPGVWKYTVRYEGRNYTQEFDVCDESSLTPLRAIKLNKFFPNPTSDVLNLQMQINEQGVYQFEVMSITGQMIYKKERRYLPGATQLVLPTADYDAGIYVLTIRNANTGERYRVQRFVKH